MWRKKLKAGLVSATSWLPVTSRSFGIPKGCHPASQAYARISARAGVRYFPLREARPSRRIAPRTLESRTHRGFAADDDVEPQTFLIAIPNGRTYDASCAVLTHDDRLLIDVSRQLNLAFDSRGIRGHNVFRHFWLRRCRRLAGRVAVLATAGGENYFHWMTEGLPRLEILRRGWPGGTAAIDRFIVNDGPPVIVESLAMMGIEAERLVFASPGSHYEAETLVVPSLVGRCGAVPAWACEFLRDSCGVSSRGRGSRRIYVSRRNARYRRVRNEEAVQAALGGYGFEPIVFENLDLASQMALMADVDVVVAPHGAGLTNLLWCPSGAAIVEIFSPNYVNGCYWHLASQLGMEYWYLLGQGDRPDDGGERHDVGDDIVVPIGLLVDTVRRALESRS